MYAQITNTIYCKQNKK